MSYGADREDLEGRGRTCHDVHALLAVRDEALNAILAAVRKPNGVISNQWYWEMRNAVEGIARRGLDGQV